MLSKALSWWAGIIVFLPPKAPKVLVFPTVTVIHQLDTDRMKECDLTIKILYTVTYGVSIVMGTPPIAGWFMSWNILLTWMIWG